MSEPINPEKCALIGVQISEVFEDLIRDYGMRVTATFADGMSVSFGPEGDRAVTRLELKFDMVFYFNVELYVGSLGPFNPWSIVLLRNNFQVYREVLTTPNLDRFHNLHKILTEHGQDLIRGQTDVLVHEERYFNFEWFINVECHQYEMDWWLSGFTNDFRWLKIPWERYKQELGPSKNKEKCDCIGCREGRGCFR